MTSEQPSMRIATITVGTSEGPATLYARSRSSIHQHAMNVSLRKAEERSRLHAVDGYQPSADPPPRRADLMTRFRAKEQPSKTRSKPIRSRISKAEEPANMDADDLESMQLIQPKVPRYISDQLFPFETGLDGHYLQDILGDSLFGQIPHIVNPEGSHFDYALHDDALRNGLLALACLGRDLDRHMKASKLCLRLKGQTIRAVRQRLSGDLSDLTVGTIGAIAALAAFDLLECLGKPEPRPDSMSFLQLAVTKKGGLNGLTKEVVDSYGQCYMLRRIILWLDLSFAIMDETPTHFSYYNAPIHLASTALHTVSLHMTPLRVVFAELSELSRSADEVDTEPSSTQRIALGDSVSGLEQYALNLSATEIDPSVNEILRLATFLYSARYIRRFSSNSRVQMGLAIRLQKCFSVRSDSMKHPNEAESRSHHVKYYPNSLERTILVWALTVAASSSGGFKEIAGQDEPERRLFWSKHIVSVLRSFDLESIADVERMLHGLTRDTKRCQKDRRVLLKACGIPEESS